MGHWKAELDALVAETRSFTSAIHEELARPAPQPKESIERIGLKPLDYGGSERDEILKRVQNFRTHQQRFIQEREEFAASMLFKLKPLTKS